MTPLSERREQLLHRGYGKHSNQGDYRKVIRSVKSKLKITKKTSSKMFIQVGICALVKIVLWRNQSKNKFDFKF